MPADIKGQAKQPVKRLGKLLFLGSKNQSKSSKSCRLLVNLHSRLLHCVISLNLPEMFFCNFWKCSKLGYSLCAVTAWPSPNQVCLGCAVQKKLSHCFSSLTDLYSPLICHASISSIWDIFTAEPFFKLRWSKSELLLLDLTHTQKGPDIIIEKFCPLGLFSI